jgi:hypothetical protein
MLWKQPQPVIDPNDWEIFKYMLHDVVFIESSGTYS